MKDKDGASGGDIVGLLTEENGSKGVTQEKKRGFNHEFLDALYFQSDMRLR